MYTTWLCYNCIWEDQAPVVSSCLRLISMWNRSNCYKQADRFILFGYSFYCDVYCLLFCSVISSNCLWLASDNSEEVAAAISQTLRNSLVRHDITIYRARNRSALSTCSCQHFFHPQDLRSDAARPLLKSSCFLKNSMVITITYN